MGFPSYLGLPATWRGRELLTRPDWSSTFSACELDELEACARAIGEAALETRARTDVSLPSLSARLREVQGRLETGTCFHDHFGATAAGALRGGMRPAGRPHL